MISIKTLKSILVWLCKLVLAILDPHNTRGVEDVGPDLKDLSQRSGSLQSKPINDYSKDAEIEFLRKKADVLEKMLRDEIQRNTEQQKSLKAPPPSE